MTPLNKIFGRPFTFTPEERHKLHNAAKSLVAELKNQRSGWMRAVVITVTDMHKIIAVAVDRSDSGYEAHVGRVLTVEDDE